MIVVVDASVAVACLLQEAHSPAANQLLAAAHQFISLDLNRVEIANALLKAVRNKRMSVADAQRGLRGLDLFPLTLYPAAERIVAAFAIAQRHGGTTYDACYIDLARAMSADLATDDEGMATIAEAVGVTVHRASRGFTALLS